MLKIKEIPYVSRGDGYIYFLLKGNKIVYIGSTINLYSRLGDHAFDEGKVFNKVCYMPCPADKLESVEMRLIKTYEPSLNFKYLKKKRKAKTITSNLLCIETIEREIKKLGLTKAEFATTKLNVTRQRFHSMLRYATLKTAEKIGKALDVSWRDLVIG